VKVIFFDIEGVFHLGDFYNIERICRYNEPSKARYICSDLLNRQAIFNFNKIMSSVQNVWLVTTSSWRDLFTIDDLQFIFDNAGFKYQYRIFDSIPKWSAVRTKRVSMWLTTNVEMNEVGSFAILDSTEPKGILENYSVQTQYSNGLSIADCKIIISNFNANEYRLDKIWNQLIEN
jgi:hypothetical protein